MYFKLPDFLQCSNLDLLFPGPSFFLPPFVSLAYIYYRNKLHTVKMLHLSYRGTTVRMPLQWDYRGMDHQDGRSNHRGVLLLTALLIWPHSAASPPEPHLVMVPPKSWFLWWTSGPDLNSHEQNRKLTAWHRPLLWWSPVLTSWICGLCSPCSQNNSLSSSRVQVRGRPCQWWGVSLHPFLSFLSLMTVPVDGLYGKRTEGNLPGRATVELKLSF